MPPVFRPQPDVACYVTNYGTPGGDPAKALAAAVKHTAPGATVGMDYTALPGSSEKVVKFYVWDQAGKLASQAQLDSEGPKPVPQICLACHGGSYDQENNWVKGASFREFDIFSFLYSKQPGVTASEQIEKFRTLNQIVKASNPYPGIARLIDGIFPPPKNTDKRVETVIGSAVETFNSGVVDSGPAPVENWVPAGWGARPELYTKITRVYCRACHIAQGPDLDFTQFGNFNDRHDQIEKAVCTDRIMPHAEVPFLNFWASTDAKYLAAPQTTSAPETTWTGFAACPTTP